MKKYIALLFGAVVVQAASITTAVSCTTNEGTVSDVGACNLAGSPGGNAQASASGSWSTSGNGFTVNAQAIASAAPTWVGLGQFINTASAKTNISVTLTTEGNGSGFMSFSPWACCTSKGPGDGGAQLSVSLTENGIAILEEQCANNLSCEHSGNGMVSIQLGTVLVFSETMGAATDSGDENGDGRASFGQTFQFFGEDGSTPIDVVDPADVPEAPMWALCGFGLGVSILWRRRCLVH